MADYNQIDRYKAAVDAIRPFEGETLKRLRDYYRIGLTWASNALEGNSLTETETKVILEDGLTVGGKPLRDIYEAAGHGDAYDFMFGLINDKKITNADIKEIHRQFYKQIDEKNAGTWRKNKIIVTGSDYAFPKPEELDGLMSGFESWIENDRSKYHPVEFAALLHLKFVTIHPFTDGNGRVSRLIMNLALLQCGYLLAIIPPICRAEYLDVVKAYQNKGNAAPFCGFIAERVLETEKEMMRLLHIPFPE